MNADHKKVLDEYKNQLSKFFKSFKILTELDGRSVYVPPRKRKDFTMVRESTYIESELSDVVITLFNKSKEEVTSLNETTNISIQNFKSSKSVKTENIKIDELESISIVRQPFYKHVYSTNYNIENSLIIDNKTFILQDIILIEVPLTDIRGLESFIDRGYSYYTSPGTANTFNDLFNTL